MKKNFSSGQALTEYGIMLVMVALVVMIVLAVLDPSIGRLFGSSVNSVVNSDVKNVGFRVTLTVAALTAHPVTNTPIVPTNTPVPPTNTPLPGTNTPIPPSNTPRPPTSTFTYTPTPAGAWVFCANENGTCAFTGTFNVRYGAPGYYIYKMLTNGTPCTNAVFTDPIVGTAKTCYYWDPGMLGTATNTATNTATFTPVPPTSTNTNTATNTRTNTPTNTATNTPIPPTNTRTNTSTPSATFTPSFTPSGPTNTARSTGWRDCGNEGTFCWFTGAKQVRYGVTGSWSATLTLTDGTWCTNAVFGDPAVGTAKKCQFK
jgi:Flp pilus assembly pilin Flp